MIFGIDISIFIFLVLCLSLVAIFEFINGFHDTANAVAPVIYTNSLKPKYAVLLSGTMNFFGVILGGIGVAMAIVHLLPLDVISYQSTGFGIIVVVSLLLSAILWNFATWYFGIPASSSHSLIGGIIGVTLSMMLVPIKGGIQVVPNWAKAQEVIESLLISPFVGFFLAIVVMSFSYKLIKSKYYFSTPDNLGDKPKTWLRSLLIASSAWVSFAHGSNDGQKGVGLAVLILVILVPSSFATNSIENLQNKVKNISYIQNSIDTIKVNSLNENDKKLLSNAKESLNSLNIMIISNSKDTDKLKLRLKVLELQKNIKNLGSIKSGNGVIGSAYATSVLDSKSGKTNSVSDVINNSSFKENVDTISSIIDYAPKWIIFLISLSLGLGTMIGWKRIVTTIGEKIGKTKMNYAQATTSSLMTAITISLASTYHLPVSTTHVLSSSVAGSMFVGKKSGGVRGDTIKNILIAWVLTLPVTILLSGTIFLSLWFVFIR